MWQENRKYPYAQGCGLSWAYSNVIVHARSPPWAYGGTKAPYRRHVMKATMQLMMMKRTMHTTTAWFNTQQTAHSKQHTANSTRQTYKTPRHIVVYRVCPKAHYNDDTTKNSAWCWYHYMYHDPRFNVICILTSVSHIRTVICIPTSVSHIRTVV